MFSGDFIRPVRTSLLHVGWLLGGLWSWVHTLRSTHFEGMERSQYFSPGITFRGAGPSPDSQRLPSVPQEGRTCAPEGHGPDRQSESHTVLDQYVVPTKGTRGRKCCRSNPGGKWVGLKTCSNPGSVRSEANASLLQASVSPLVRRLFLCSAFPLQVTQNVTMTLACSLPS